MSKYLYPVENWLTFNQAQPTEADKLFIKCAEIKSRLANMPATAFVLGDILYLSGVSFRVGHDGQPNIEDIRGYMGKLLQIEAEAIKRLN